MTVRNVAALVALASLAVGVRSARSQPAQHTVTACTSERWLPPRELRTRAGYTVFLERPSIAPLRNAVFLAAWPTGTYDSLGTVIWPLAPAGKPSATDHVALGVVVGRDGVARLIPWPHGMIDGPWMPIATADDKGIAHVIWGSQDNVPPSSLYMVRALWYARFDGAVWSTPTRVLATNGTIMWNSAQISPLVARGRSLHLVVGVQGEGLRYVRSAGDVWTDHHVTIPSDYQGYPHIAVLSSGRLVLMVQGNVDAPARSISGFLITRSDDGGQSWSPPVAISTPAEGPGYDGRLVVDERDILSAFWYQQTDSLGRPAERLALGGSPGRIYATQSFDRGLTWRPARPSSLIENANELQVLPRPDHSVLTVVADGQGERMLISSWSKGWSPFTVIGAKPSPINPSLGMDDAQRPLLTWAIRRSHDWLGTMATTLVVCR